MKSSPVDRSDRFTVAITTYNRAALLPRAIDSALHQESPAAEILVVDDASTDNTGAVIRERYPQVRHLRQSENRGVCAARNRALREAAGDWVVMLDDDDSLLPDALSFMREQIAQSPQWKKHPALHFARSNGRALSAFTLARVDDYIDGAVSGDFLPVIRRDEFLRLGLAYPEIRAAGESLLWWKIAAEHGIPTWSRVVAQTHCDAPNRLTSAENQMRNAAAYAEYQEMLLAEFGEFLLRRFPGYYRLKVLGAAAYRLLAGDRPAARAHLRSVLRRRLSASACALWALTFLPLGFTRRCFVFFRGVSRAKV